MELWWRLRGWARVRLTSADCVDRLQAFSREMRLEQIAFASPLEAEFTMLRADVKKLNAHDGEKLEVIRAGGFPSVLDSMRRWWILMFLVVLLVMLTVFLSGRILFFRVEGNGDVPARLILEQVEDCGVRFGASARELRSEQVKNHLLWAIPELRWAGVNIRGCTATITVALRQSGQEPADECPGDVVAVVDAVVTEVYPQSGTAQVSPGQAVREGEVLISGTTDLGLCTRVERAEGEVYGLSRREVKAVLPSETAVRQESSRVIRKFSLRIGKKYVKFSNDSGILYGTCVKMRTVKYLTLPGGFQLPVALVTDTYQMCQTQVISREVDPEELMTQTRRYVREQMCSGIIEQEKAEISGNALNAVFECREMIGAFRPGNYTEGDTNERENRERGAS